MKNLGVLVFLTLAVSQLLDARLTHLTPGNEYHYDYYGHYLTKLANVGNRQVGMGLKGKVIIQVKSPEQTIFKIQNLKTAMLNEDLEQVDEDAIPWQFQEGQSSMARHLEQPVRVHWSDGRVKSIDVSAEDPEESLNIKKAIITLYQLNTPRISSPPTSSSGSSFYSQSSTLYAPASQSKKNLLYGKSDNVVDDVHVFKTMEDGIGGECETRYIVESNPSPFHPQAEVLNITKMKNYRKCTHRPRWVRTTHIPNKCADCDADDQHPFATVSTIQYDIKKRGNELVIEEIEVEAQTLFAPFTTNSDHFIANHSQILTLRKVSQISSSSFTVVNPKSISSLKYTFPTAKRARQQGLHDSLKKSMVPFLHDYKMNFVPQAKKLLEEITNEIINEHSENRHIEETPLKVYKLVKIIRLMNKDEVSQFYNEACSSQRERQSSSRMDAYGVSGNEQRQICIDALVMSGSYPAILKVKYLVESKMITGERAVQAVQAMPTNIYEPTHEILSEILNLAKSSTAKEHTQLRKTAWLSFAILVGKACDGPQDEVPTVPTPPHISTFCPQEVERKYIQELAQQLRSSQRKGTKLMFIRALGLTELPTAVEPLRPYAEGIALEDEVIQVAALHALKAIAKFAPEEVMDIAEGEFYDTDNPKSVRLAALRTILGSQPEYEDLQRVVAWSQKEPSDDIQSFIYSAFDSISNATHYCMKDLANSAEQLMAYLDDEDDNGIKGSNVWETSQIFDDLGISTQAILSWTTSNSSVIPETIVGRINTTVAGYSHKPLKFAVQIKGAQPIINRLIGPSGAFNKIRSIEDLLKPETEVQDKQRTNINSKLNLDTREDPPFFMSAFVKIGDTQARMISLDHQQVIDYVKSGMQNGYTLGDLQSGIPIHYQKASLLHEVQFQTPSILGVPILVEVFTPTITTLKGKISARIEGLSSQSLPAIHLEADVRPSISSRVEMRLGVYNPIMNIVSSAALATSTYFAPPISVNVNVNPIQGKVSLDVKPSTSAYQSSASSPKVFHYKVKPYSIVRPLTASSVSKESVRAMTIHADLEPEVIEIDLSQQMLGIPVVFKSKSEHDWTDLGSFWSAWEEYDSVFSLLATWLATPEFAARQYEVYLEGRSAQGKEIELSAEWEYQPTPGESIAFQSRKSARGFWTVLSGFSQLPQRCGSKGSQDFESDSDSWYYNRQSRMNINDDDDDDNNNDDDDDDYNNDDDDYLSIYGLGKQSSNSRFSYNASHKQFTKSPWAYSRQLLNSNDDLVSLSQSFQPNQYDDEDDDDDSLSTTGSQRQGMLPYSTKMRKSGSLTIEKISRANEKMELHLRLKAIAKGSSTAKIASNLVLKRDLNTLTDIVSLTLEMNNIPALSAQNVKICTTASIKYPEVPCDFHSKMSTSAAQPIHANIAMSWGPQCPSSNRITVKATFEKSREQERMERQKDDWYFRQCQKDIAQGKKLSEACELAQLEFSSLNKMVLDVEFTKLSPWLKNLTSWADIYLKSKLYKQMTNNPVDVHNGEGRLKVVGILRNEVQAVDLLLFKPKENTFFKKVAIDEELPSFLYVYPISTQTTFLEQLVEDITNGQAYPSCEVMGQHINTFDNLTYKYPLGGCHHVIAKDCSPDDLFAVTMAQAGNTLKTMNVHLLSHKIAVTPKGRYSGQFQVEVDGQIVHPTDEQVIILKSQDDEAASSVLALMVKTGPVLHITAPQTGVKIEFDGEDADIEVSALWANKVCGLCGQFNDESEDDFKGPQQCLYPDPISFGLSYGLSGAQCQLPSAPNHHKLCEATSPSSNYRRRSSFDDYDDVDTYESSSDSSRRRMDDMDYDDNRRQRPTPYDDDDDDNDDNNDDDNNNDDYSSTSGRQMNSQCEAKRNQIKYKHGQICFSVSPVKECQNNCMEKNVEDRKIGYHCLPQGEAKTEQLKEAREYRPLTELSNKKVDFYEDTSIPTSCKSY